MLVSLISGCADTLYLKRLEEIETAYQNQEITTAEYISLKNQADQTHETRKLRKTTGVIAGKQ